MARTTITSIRAREILDSRGNPTLDVTVSCEGGSGSFAVPSGASTGSHEALELRDGDMSRFLGRGVLKAATHVNVNLSGLLTGMDALDQRAVDGRMIELDGTANKSNIGGNATIGVSLACARAAAASTQLPLAKHLHSLAPKIKPSRTTPFLCMNVINGGKHAATNVAFQEYKIIPQTADIHEALMIGTQMSHALKDMVSRQYGAQNANVGDEGGLAPHLESIRRPLELLMEVAQKLRLDQKIKLALDVAASSFYDATTKSYVYDDAQHATGDLTETLRSLMRDFPIQYIEDPYHEEAFEDFTRLNDGTCLIVGDDLTVTNRDRIALASSAQSVSGVIIKPNQIGTLSETLDAIQYARDHGIECIISHRSGETNDAFIVDLALAFGSYGIKAGGLQRGERIAKYNRFLELL